jgi:molybdate transport system substrate-binding protein
MRNGLPPAGIAGVLAALVICYAMPSQAAEITVLAGMGVISGVSDLAPAYEKLTGHTVTVKFEQAAALNAMINSGAQADIAALQPEQVDTFIKQGKMVPGTKTNFAQAGVGVAVKTGAPRPDISSAEAFKNAMISAKSIGYSQAGSGLIAAKVMEKLGIADQLKPKTKFINGLPVAEAVAKGEVEIGLQQINVIIPVEGADYIGPLPNELQDTVRFSGGVLTASKQKDLARAFLNFIASADAGPLLRRSAMEPWH